MVSAESVFDGLKSPRYDEDLLEIAGLLIDKKAPNSIHRSSKTPTWMR